MTVSDLDRLRIRLWLALSPRLGQNTSKTELPVFFQKNHILLSNFFSSSNMLFIRLFLKKKSGVTRLVSSQTAVKCGHGFGDHSQDGELARWGLGRDTKMRPYYAQKRLRNTGNHLNYIAKVLIYD